MEHLPILNSGAVKQLRVPAADSYKGQNGILTVIGGSEKYHGAPLLSILAASRIVDLVYFHSPEPSNLSLMLSLKSKSRVFIPVSKTDLKATLDRSDCILIGNGMIPDDTLRKTVNGLLKSNPDKKFVLDAAALRVVDVSRLGPNCLLTPHANEFYALFGIIASPQSVAEQAKETGAVILSKGKFDFISDGKTTVRNVTGNEGMTKGGTGDVLAGLAAGFACTNGLFASACAAAYLNGLAGDALKKKNGIMYNAEDLANALPGLYKKLLD